MATSKVTPFVSHAQVVPTVEPITQLEFEMYLSLCNQLEQLKAQISTEEEALRARLESGASVNPGNRVVGLKQHLRRPVDWKDVAIRLAVRLKPGVR
jgi:hypothetical protein